MRKQTLKVGDRVIYSPYIGCDEEDKKEFIVREEPWNNPNAGCETLFLEGKSGWVDAEHCELIS